MDGRNEQTRRDLENHEPEDRNCIVLCGCGWGNLCMKESEVPVHCPICNNVIPGMDEYAFVDVCDE
jgi:hypothetical protein